MDRGSVPEKGEVEWFFEEISPERLPFFGTRTAPNLWINPLELLAILIGLVLWGPAVAAQAHDLDIQPETDSQICSRLTGRWY